MGEVCLVVNSLVDKSLRGIKILDNCSVCNHPIGKGAEQFGPLDRWLCKICQDEVEERRKP